MSVRTGKRTTCAPQLVTWGHLQRLERRATPRTMKMAHCKRKYHILHVLDSKPWVGTYWILADLTGIATGDETELPSQSASCCLFFTDCLSGSVLWQTRPYNIWCQDLIWNQMKKNHTGGKYPGVSGVTLISPLSSSERRKP